MHRVGKQIGEDLYVHLSAVEHLADRDHWALIRDAIELLPIEARATVNVAKIGTRTQRVTLLEYTGFDSDPFPALARSWTRSAVNAPGLTVRSYADSLNPPILHRKELLVHPEHPGRARWCALTAEAEGLGLFDDTKTIGFRMNWERAVSRKGYQLQGEQFMPLGNAVEAAADGVL